MSQTGMIAVDWGTTNRRIYKLAPDGTCEAGRSDSMGVLSVPPGGFEAEIAAMRAEFGAGPMLLAGMVGSDRGWREVPYVPCPVDLSALRQALCWVNGGDIAIVPGVSFIEEEGRGDVMRGEEVQILGAVAAGLCPADALVCHPGTHAKWVRLKSGAMTGFRTVMTGELFALLRGGGILAPQLQGEAKPDADFARGVEAAFRNNALSADLFSARAGALLGLRGRDAASYVSGLLIGADIGIGLVVGGERDDVVLIGEEALTTLYAAALDIAGRRMETIDGEVAFLAGARALMEERR
ncbi:2-dehydro-3-deoxygalactonokinase [Sphingobium sp. DEHP117]|uniref:2-dehydro-3-deoxygalactonokinase n=1 Tax=Sphingobium sp. DEHP117 TaxID=2993436 RepID=UPI0027D74CF8|nr:2-dehydro-3-deoxygalactonokinase [Sphingobium sp. DEHP117]MDQ4418991.1 2-dehydro-3-deoxygalactonokinase [Sphingobium sp. DEHP117]